MRTTDDKLIFEALVDKPTTSESQEVTLAQEIIRYCDAAINAPKDLDHSTNKEFFEQIKTKAQALIDLHKQV